MHHLDLDLDLPESKMARTFADIRIFLMEVSPKGVREAGIVHSTTSMGSFLILDNKESISTLHRPHTGLRSKYIRVNNIFLDELTCQISFTCSTTACAN